MMGSLRSPFRRRWWSSGGHPARRDGGVALLLFLTPGLVALVLADRDRGLDSGSVAILVSIAVGLPVLWLTWALYRDSRRFGSAVPDLEGVADRLAVAVREQWAAEAEIRGINDPFPLPVSWVPADAALADPWDSLVELASYGAGWSKPPAADAWARDPSALSGTGNDLAEVLAMVPTGRLVVLGEPGSGKTMLMVRLVLDLLARREPGAAVPVLFSAASWNPQEEGLYSWLCAQLLIDHPALAVAWPEDRIKPLARALLDRGLILPVVDGLDEIPHAVRASAIRRMNEAVQPGSGLIVTSRVSEYQAVVRPGQGPEVTMRAAAAVELLPLSADAVSRYLRAGATGPRGAARWDPVLALLGTQAPVGQALSTPLMTGLARVIYDPPADLASPPIASPAELCDPALSSREQVEAHLLDAFVPAAYRRRPGRWNAVKAERWHIFLAARLTRDSGGPDLAWWQFHSLAPANVTARWPTRAVRVVVGILLAVTVGLAEANTPGLGVPGGIVGGFLGLGLGWASGLLTRSRTSAQPMPSNEIRVKVDWSWRTFVALPLTLLFAMGVTFAIQDYLTSSNSILIQVLGAAVTIIFFLAIWAALNLAAVPVDLAAATVPRDTLRRDRRAALRVGLAAGGTSMVIAGVLAGAEQLSVEAGLVFGLSIGLPVAVRRARRQTASPSYGLAILWLALHRKLPLALMSFLDDAHERGVMRQSGATYQFRHIELQNRLAARAHAQGALSTNDQQDEAEIQKGRSTQPYPAET